MTISITWSSHGVIASFRGTIGRDQIFEAFRLIESDPRFDDLRYSIIDLRGVAHAGLDAATLEEIAAENWAASASNRKLRTVAVATDPLIVEAVRHYERVMPNPRHIPAVEIFDSVEAAMGALGIPPA